MAILKNYPDTSTPLTAEFLLNYCHPIGEIFFTEDDNFNPNEEWGGTWELDTDGVVYGSKSDSNTSMFNTNTGSIIGEEKHTLTIDEMPSHLHDGINWLGNVEYPISLNQNSSQSGYKLQWDGGAGGGRFGTTSSGGGQPHNNVQRTRICNIWRRIA